MTIQWTDELQAVARECVAKGVSQTVTAEILGVSITALLRFTDHAGLTWATTRGPYTLPPALAARNEAIVSARQEGVTLCAIAATHRLSIERVRRILRKYGVMGRRQKFWSADDLQRVLDLVSRGRTFEQIGREFGVSRNGVAWAIKRARGMVGPQSRVTLVLPSEAHP